MMKQEFLNKAKENLKIAQMSFDNECYNVCATRAYFSAFQAAIAALADKGCLTRGKNDHGYIQSEFSFQLIKRHKIYPAKLKSYLIEMQLIRNRAHYEGHHVNRRNASEKMSRAEEMLMYIGKEIGR